MARTSNKDKAIAYAAEHGIILTVEDRDNFDGDYAAPHKISRETVNPACMRAGRRVMCEAQQHDTPGRKFPAKL